MAIGIDLKELRRALGAFMTGVTVITTLDETGAPRGFTANSFTSVSLDPPLVLFCVAKAAATAPVFAAASAFAVNILAEGQREISGLFAAKVADRFGKVDWRPGETGSPVLAGAAAWLDCRRHDVVDAGDHLVVIGRVIAFDHGPANPLGYCRGSYITSGLEQAAVAAARLGTRVGAVLERGDRLLLLDDPVQGGLAPPISDRLGKPGQGSGLHGRLDSLGVEADIGFLYAVFEDKATGALTVYYRGEIAGTPPAELESALYAFDDIPWPRLADDTLRNMLRRYVVERREDFFGIYIGDREAGRVRRLVE